ncbi:MAG TPA: GNAT family N-acetyltransferase [Thermomicrobiales bacterium]|nr:GNAT family N-acetyltransferase [Thermomicrobiales bacterium]
MKQVSIGPLTVRPIALESDDREQLTAFLARLGATSGVVPGMNIGEINWMAYRVIEPSFADSAALITDDAGTVRGMVWLEPDDEFAVEVDPNLANDADLLEGLARYALAELIALSPDVTTPRGSTLLRSDHALCEALGRIGMTTDGTVRHHTFRRDLTRELEVLALPAGCRFNDVHSDDQIAERAAADVAVWPTSSIDAGNYRGVQTAALYRSDLDLIVESNEGVLAAFCLGWFEPHHRVAQFEPIGVLEAFRGLRIGKAIVLEGLRRARELGATVVYINCSATNEAGNALYRSVGCDLVGEWIWWEQNAP